MWQGCKIFRFTHNSVIPWDKLWFTHNSPKPRDPPIYALISCICISEILHVCVCKSMYYMVFLVFDVLYTGIANVFIFVVWDFNTVLITVSLDALYYCIRQMKLHVVSITPTGGSTIWMFLLIILDLVTDWVVSLQGTCSSILQNIQNQM